MPGWNPAGSLWRLDEGHARGQGIGRAFLGGQGAAG